MIELQVGPVSAILGFYLLAQCSAGSRPASALGDFAVGAVVPTLVLLGYNQLAFGSPWDMGYFHHATAIFAEVHNAAEPARACSRPDWSQAVAAALGRLSRPALLRPDRRAGVPGLVVLAARRLWGMAVGLVPGRWRRSSWST